MKKVTPPVVRLHRELKYRGKVLGIYEDRVLANGIEEQYDFIHHDGAAAVIPIADDGRILMVRQYRNALDRFTLEIPAGKKDTPSEPTLKTAKRELEEEAGYVSDDLSYLMTVNTTVAFCDEKIDIYLAKNLKKTSPHPDPDEVIEVELHTLGELTKLIFEGKLTDSKTVAAILGYALLSEGRTGLD